jgi:hypothetical protein
MSMPRHVYLEALQLAAEYARLDEIKVHKRNLREMDRMTEITRRLERIESLYTFDSDQEEQMT